MATNVMRSWQREHLMEQRVLIVEDELLIALDLEMTIENMGVHVAGLASDREGPSGSRCSQTSPSSMSISQMAQPARRSAGSSQKTMAFPSSS